MRSLTMRSLTTRLTTVVLFALIMALLLESTMPGVAGDDILRGQPLINSVPLMNDEQLKSLIDDQMIDCFTAAQSACPSFLNTNLKKLNPEELSKALNKLRSKPPQVSSARITGTSYNLNFDFSHLPESSTFNPLTGVLKLSGPEGKISSVNIYELPNLASLKSQSDGSMLVNEVPITGILHVIGSQEGSSGLFTLEGTVGGITPSPTSPFKLFPRTTQRFQIPGGEQQSIHLPIPTFIGEGDILATDPNQDNLFSVNDNGPLKKGALHLPGGHVMTSGFLYGRGTQFSAPDFIKNPIIDGFEIDATGEQLPIFFTSPKPGQERYAFLSQEKIEVNGEGAKVILREGNTISPFKDYQPDPATKAKIPLDYAAIFSHGGRITLTSPEEEGDQPSAVVTGKAGVENYLWKFSSDGFHAFQGPLTSDRDELKKAGAYDAIGMNIIFKDILSEDNKDHAPYSVRIIDNPLGAVDQAITPRFKTWINSPARTQEETNSRVLSGAKSFLGILVDLDDGVPESETYSGTQMACIDVACQAAKLAGSPIQDLMIEDGFAKTSDPYSLRRNSNLVKTGIKEGFYQPIGRDYFQNPLDSDLPQSLLQTLPPTSLVKPKPGDVLILGAYKMYNPSTKTWGPELYSNYHSVVISSVTAEGRIDAVVGASLYDPNVDPNSPERDFTPMVRRFKIDTYIQQRKAGISTLPITSGHTLSEYTETFKNNPGMIGYRRYVPQGIISMPPSRTPISAPASPGESED